MAYNGHKGNFDLTYSAANKKIVASIKIKLAFVDWQRTDATGNVTRDSSGHPTSVPFDTDMAAKVARHEVNIVEVSRAFNTAATVGWSASIEADLNRSYKLKPDNCSLGTSCSCAPIIEFKVSFVETGDHHAQLKVFPMAVRANSSHIGEMSVRQNPNPVAAAATPYVPVAGGSVKSHEAGHLFGWPDEYFIGGGAVHGRYVGPNGLVDTTMAEPPDGWKRYSPTNLMGGGAHASSPQVPKYYMTHIESWFESKTGVSWHVE